jgi:hypothetical protein
MLQRTVFIYKNTMLQQTQIIQQMMLQSTVFIKKSWYNEHICYNEQCYNVQCSSIKLGCYKERMIQWKVFINKSGSHNEHRCYNERWYNEQFINKIRMLQRTQMLHERLLSIKSGCYNERGEILSADVARSCAWRVWPSPFDQSVSHHLCYRL